MKVFVNRTKKKKLKYIFAAILAVTVFLAALFDIQLRAVLNKTTTATGTNILSSAANNATLAVCRKNNITYDKIVKLTRNNEGNITSLEIDVQAINLMKASLSSEIGKELENTASHRLKIPIGTIIGNDFTVGRGPCLSFKSDITANVSTTFHNRFYSAGINQVLHQIIIEVKMNGQVIMPFYRNSFSATTSIIAAQTVLVGVTPETFTNVEESDPDKIAEDIFNFSPN